MKQIWKTLLAAVGLVLCFTLLLGAGAAALTRAPEKEKEYAVEDFVDKALFGGMTEPQTQAELQKKFEVYNAVTTEERDGKEYTVLTLFPGTQANEQWARREAGERFTLTYDEVLFLINDSIQRYFQYDRIRLTGATGFGVIPQEMRQRSRNHTVYCYHGDLTGAPLGEVQQANYQMLKDLYCIVVYRIALLDSAFLYAEEYTAADGSVWLKADGMPEAILLDGSGEMGIESINVDPPIPDRRLFLKTFAETDDLARARRLAVEEYCVDWTNKASLANPARSNFYEGWMNRGLSAPLLVAEFGAGYQTVSVVQPNAPSRSYPQRAVLLPTYEILGKLYSAVYPTWSTGLGDRAFSAAWALREYPGYDITRPTEALPLTAYQQGTAGDGSGLRQGMTFREMVDQFGLPYNGRTSGLLTMVYYTAEGDTVVVWLIDVGYLIVNDVQYVSSRTKN